MQLETEKPASIAPPAEQLREASQGVQARRGVIRFLYLVVDLAEAALRERRWELLVQQSSQFAERFVTENPLSELGLLALRDASCEALAPLGTAFTAAKLNAIAKEAKGRCCAVAALQRALQGLQDVPSYGVREVLILLASDLLPTLRLKNIRVSVVSLSPEIFVLKNLCVETGGRFDVALNKAWASQDSWKQRLESQRHVAAIVKCRILYIFVLSATVAAAACPADARSERGATSTICIGGDGPCFALQSLPPIHGFTRCSVRNLSAGLLPDL
eukprot:g28796.t2